MITIDLTEQDAELFREFRKNQDLFCMLLNGGVFTTQNGQVTLNFDPMGTLTHINQSVITYKRPRPTIVVVHNP